MFTKLKTKLTNKKGEPITSIYVEKGSQIALDTPSVSGQPSLRIDLPSTGGTLATEEWVKENGGTGGSTDLPETPSTGTHYLTSENGKLEWVKEGAANGVASLDETGKVPEEQIPGFQTIVFLEKIQ